METKLITAVGIDVSKGKSTVAVRQPGGVILQKPFEVKHNAQELKKLTSFLKTINGEIRIVMEHTSMYWQPIAQTLLEAGFFVSVVNAMLIHDFTDNSIRKIKTDNADALKIANYALTFWSELHRYSGEDEVRQMLKMQSRLYERTMNISVNLKNGLISLTDQAFPDVNKVFGSELRTTRGHVKWVDFVLKFWHKDCVAAVSLNSFTDTFRKWCKRTGYHFNPADAQRIHSVARSSVATLHKNDKTKLLIIQAVNCLNAVYESLQTQRDEMYRLASLLPEFEVVMNMHGAGKITGPQLMAEIGDVRRFTHKGALVAFAGVDAPPYQSGSFEAKSRHVSKRGSTHLRKTLFTMLSMILAKGNREDPVFCFMDRKRAEGKHYYVYIVAGAAKFLRIYYARVKEYMDRTENIT